MWQGCSLHTTELPTALCIVGGQDRQYAIMISGGGNASSAAGAFLKAQGSCTYCLVQQASALMCKAFRCRFLM